MTFSLHHTLSVQDMQKQVEIGESDLDRAVSPETCSARAVDVDRVESTHERLLGRGDAVQVADVLRPLGDPGRVQILCALLEAGELCVCDLAMAVNMAESTMSHSLRLLRAARIVRHRRSGRRVFYGLDDAHVRLLLDVSVEHVRHGATS